MSEGDVGYTGRGKIELLSSFSPLLTGHCLLFPAFFPPVFFAQNDRRMTSFSLSLKTREGSGLIFRHSEDFVQTNHPEELSDLF